jgi:Mg-chelatase subunit ChlD
VRDWTVLAPCNGPDGNTPLELAFRVADGAIQVARDGGLLEQRFIVLLLTDGEPNCNSDLGVVTSLAAKWHEQGITTYVFGLPGSEGASAVLDSIAIAGGSEVYTAPGAPVYAAPATPDELQQGMAATM